jgi:hypothetical protein
MLQSTTEDQPLLATRYFGMREQEEQFKATLDPILVELL